MATVVKLTYMLTRHLLSLFDYLNNNCTSKLKLFLFLKYSLQVENVIRKVPINIVVTMATNLPMTN